MTEKIYQYCISRVTVPLTGATLEFMNTNRMRNRYNARRNGRCAQPDYRRCPGECSGCGWEREGFNMLTFSATDVPAGAEAAPSAEEEALLRLSLEETADRLDRHYRDGGTVFCMLAQGYSNREIADALHITRGSASQRTRLIRRWLREHREDYFGGRRDGR